MGSCLRKPPPQKNKPEIVYDPPSGQEGYGYSLLKQHKVKEVEPWNQVDLDFYAVPLEEPKLDEPERIV